MDKRIPPRIDQRVYGLLQAKKLITCKDVLAAGDLELIESLDLPFVHVQSLVTQVSKFCYSHQPKSVKEVSANKSVLHLQTHMPILDAYLRGGVQSSFITEIVGPQQVGKSHFCYMLAVMATLPKAIGGVEDNRSVLFLGADRSFSFEHFQSVASSMFPEEYGLGKDGLIQLLQNVLVETITSPPDLAQKLEDVKFEEFIIDRKIKLIVVDSLASLSRSFYEQDISAARNRQPVLSNIATKLKYYAEALDIPILVVNDIVVMKDGTTGFGDSLFSERSATAALGTVWSHCVNTRLVLEPDDWYKYQDLGVVPIPEKPLKMFTIAKSPVSPVLSFPVLMTPKGFDSLERPNSDDAMEVSDLDKFIIDLAPANYWEQKIVLNRR